MFVCVLVCQFVLYIYIFTSSSVSVIFELTPLNKYSFTHTFFSFFYQRPDTREQILDYIPISVLLSLCLRVGVYLLHIYVHIHILSALCLSHISGMYAHVKSGLEVQKNCPLWTSYKDDTLVPRLFHMKGLFCRILSLL